MNASTELIEYVKRTVLLANTPAFIFNTLRDVQDLLEFANSNSSSDLKNKLSDLSQKTNRKPEDLAIAYLLLVALSYKPNFNIREIDLKDLQWIDWSSEIVSLISMVNSSTVFTDSIEGFCQPEKSSQQIIADSSVTYEVINFNKHKRE